MCTDLFAGSGMRRWMAALMLLSLLGVADSSLLLRKHRRSPLLTTGSGGSAFCPAGGCDVVNQGEYAEVKGIPLAAIGIGGYLTLLALSIVAAVPGSRGALGAIFAVSGIGVLVSAYLVYLQVAVIKAICSWCVLSALTMALIFAVSVALLRRMRPREQSETAGQQRAR